MFLTPPQIVFAAVVTLALGQLAFVAPSGQLLVAAPPPVKASIRGPSVRGGSAGSHSFFFWGGGGGYHGGK